MVCLSRRSGPCGERIAASGPSARIATLGISTTNATSLRGSFARTEAGAALLARMRRSGARDFLRVFAFEASDAVYFLTGRGFEVAQVTD